MFASVISCSSFNLRLAFGRVSKSNIDRVMVRWCVRVSMFVANIIATSICIDRRLFGQLIIIGMHHVHRRRRWILFAGLDHGIMMMMRLLHTTVVVIIAGRHVFVFTIFGGQYYAFIECSNVCVCGQWQHWHYMFTPRSAEKSKKKKDKLSLLILMFSSGLVYFGSSLTFCAQRRSWSQWAGHCTAWARSLFAVGFWDWQCLIYEFGFPSNIGACYTHTHTHTYTFLPCPWWWWWWRGSLLINTIGIGFASYCAMCSW